MTRTELHALWDKSVSAMLQVLLPQFNQITDPQEFLSLRYALVLFASAMEQYGFTRQALDAFLLSLAPRFDQLITVKLRLDLKKIFTLERFEPLTVLNRNEYQTKVLSFALQDPSIHVTYPATMAFSESVPATCHAVRNYATLYYEYLTHLGVESGIGMGGEGVYINGVLGGGGGIGGGIGGGGGGSNGRQSDGGIEGKKNNGSHGSDSSMNSISNSSGGSGSRSSDALVSNAVDRILEQEVCHISILYTMVMIILIYFKVYKVIYYYLVMVILIYYDYLSWL